MRGASALVVRARWTIREIGVQRQHLRGAGDDLGGLFDAHAAGIDLHVVEHCALFNGFREALARELDQQRQVGIIGIDQAAPMRLTPTRATFP